MTIKKAIGILLILGIIGTSSCSLKYIPMAMGTEAPEDGGATDGSSVPEGGEGTSTDEPTALQIETLTPTTQPATLMLDQNYFCRRGPGTNYLDIVVFLEGTELPIIGSNGGAWWLVAIDDERTHHTQCWIGGGITSGDMDSVPVIPPSPETFVPVHDESNWSSLLYLACDELDEFRWIWNEFSSGEYVATTPILGVARPTILHDEWNAICPGWTPPEVVKVHDEATWQVIGYLTCVELELYAWTWNGASSGEYFADAVIFGSDRPTIYMGEVTPHCPAFSP